MKMFFKSLLVCCSVATLVACSTSGTKNSRINYKGQINDPIMAIALLSEQQYEWAGTPYVLGGSGRKGFDRFGIKLPRQTKDQANYGQYIDKADIQTGDLVFFKTGRGPNGYHVGIYVKEDKFLHASTKGGVIYSSLNSDYWRKAYWQARRI